MASDDTDKPTDAPTEKPGDPEKLTDAVEATSATADDPAAKPAAAAAKPIEPRATAIDSAVKSSAAGDFWARPPEPTAKPAEPAASEAARPPIASTKPTAQVLPDAPPITMEVKIHPPDLWDRVAGWIAKHGPLPALAVITVGTMMMFGGVFLGEAHNGDDLSFHMAEAARISDCLAGGDFDFWNPSANAGYASGYYYQVLPQLASAAPAAVFGHFTFWFQLSMFLPYLLAPAAAYRGMRLMGATPWEAVIAAGCMAFVSGHSRWGSNAESTFRVGLYTQTWALAAFPLALGYGARWIQDGKGAAQAIAWGTFVGLCHPFACAGLGLALVMGVLWRYVSTGEIWRAPIMGGLSILLAGLILGGGGIALSAKLDDDLPLFVGIGFLGLGAGLGGWRLIGGIIRARRFPRAVVEKPGRSTPIGFVVRSPLFGGGALVGAGTLCVAAGLATHAVIAFFAGAALLIAGSLRLMCVAERTTRSWGTESARQIIDEIARLTALGVMLVIATLPFWIPLVVDYAGFGGFPHRVNDEVGPGLTNLLFGHDEHVFVGYVPGGIFDFGREVPVMTIALPFIIMFARGTFLRWLWPPALFFATLLAAGPHLGTTQDDLFPMVRFLGTMQVVCALGMGAGAIAMGRKLWRWGLWKRLDIEYGARTGIAALAAACVVLVGFGAIPIFHRVVPFSGSWRDELMTMSGMMKMLPEGRKQVGPGAEGHLSNLLTYVYGRQPSTFQMGGGGLQASPNYDYLWTAHNGDHAFKKIAWLYDAPYLMFNKSKSVGLPEGPTIYSTNNYELRELPAPGLVSPVQITGVLPPGARKGEAGHDAALAWLKTDMPEKDHLLAYDGFGGPGAPPAGHTISAHHQDSPGEEPDIVAVVEATATTTFVARESWHPRWRAFIDDEEVPVRRVTPDFPAVDVPPGHHVLAFRFDRPWWANAAWLAWPLTAILAWLATRRRR